MKNLVIIRTCLRDDFIAWLCYDSFKRVVNNCDYIFFAEFSNRYEWIKRTGVKIIWREYADNFGGETCIIPYVDSLKEINTDGYDNIIICDSDIYVEKNPLVFDFDFGGVQDDTNKRHFSGQFHIYKKWLFDKVINYENYKGTIKNFKENQMNIADDTIISFVATLFTDNVKNFARLDYWHHEKRYAWMDRYKLENIRTLNG